MHIVHRVPCECSPSTKQKAIGRLLSIRTNTGWARIKGNQQRRKKTVVLRSYTCCQTPSIRNTYTLTRSTSNQLGLVTMPDGFSVVHSTPKISWHCLASAHWFCVGFVLNGLALRVTIVCVFDGMAPARISVRK